MQDYCGGRKNIVQIKVVLSVSPNFHEFPARCLNSPCKITAAGGKTLCKSRSCISVSPSFHEFPARCLNSPCKITAAGGKTLCKSRSCYQFRQISMNFRRAASTAHARKRPASLGEPRQPPRRAWMPLPGPGRTQTLPEKFEESGPGTSHCQDVLGFRFYI